MKPKSASTSSQVIGKTLVINWISSRKLAWRIYPSTADVLGKAGAGIPVPIQLGLVPHTNVRLPRPSAGPGAVASRDSRLTNVARNRTSIKWDVAISRQINLEVRGALRDLRVMPKLSSVTAVHKMHPAEALARRRSLAVNVTVHGSVTGTRSASLTTLRGHVKSISQNGSLSDATGNVAVIEPAGAIMATSVGAGGARTSAAVAVALAQRAAVPAALRDPVPTAAIRS